MGKWVHRLSNVNEETKTALCANCGLVDIKRKQNGWRCKLAERKWKHPTYTADAMLIRGDEDGS